jgi:hypothetical protein
MDYRGKTINKDVFELSKRLISEDHRNDEDILELRYRGRDRITVMDLMTMMNFHKTGVGLKQCSVNLKWHRIQDLPLPYDHKVTIRDVDTILDYNLNDTLITIELYNNKVVKDARELREQLVPEFGTKILSAAKSKMADIFLEKYYEEYTGIPKQEFKKGRTYRDTIKFSDVILPIIYFSDETFKALKEELEKVTVYAYDEFKYAKSVFYKGNEYRLGVGGLHTGEKAYSYKETSEQKILTCDVSSFYPSIMCEYDIKPEHLKDDFIEIFNKLRRERIEAKASGDKVKAESYKIVLNSSFGKTGFSDSWMYDPLALLRVTVNGQLFLLMLIERMEMAGIHVISGNTDGIEVLVPVKLENVALEIAHQWEKELRMGLEFDYYTLYIKRDVNNYIAVSKSGKKKVKGIFLDDISLEKGYKYPIIPKALVSYFLKGIPIESTIRKCEDILDFCISQKSGKDFQMLYKTQEDIFPLQKTNRFYVSNGGGALLKRGGSNGRTIGLYVGKTVKILNDYDSEVLFKDYNVNIEFYIKEAKDIIKKIEPSASQDTLFDMNENFGSMTDFFGKQVQSRKSRAKSLSKEVTIEEIKEAAKRKLTYDVDYKYGLVTDVNAKFSPILTIYSLAKGSVQKFKINKNTFAKQPLQHGDIVNLQSFEKKNKFKKEDSGFVKVENEYEWWVTAYSSVNDVDFSKFKRKTINA